MSKIEVAVSPFYRGNGWKDRGTGLEFKQQKNSGLKTRTITKDMFEDLSGIKNSLRLNHLILVKGSLTEVADEPKKINPGELTGEELDELLSSGGNSEALVKENATLKKEKETLTQEKQTLTEEKQALQQQVKDLEAQLEGPPVEAANFSTNGDISEDSTFKLNEDGSINKKALSTDNTKDELIAIAKEHNVEFSSKATKSELVDLIVEKVQ